jgi:D-glycero-beta-D-manno-heptose 1-phosphate adenylyltransferase
MMSTKHTEKILAPETNLEHRFIKDENFLKELVETFKKQGKKIVLTQGVWDLIHEGHALYLEVAKSYGDVLIVGVDSDELTRARKGPNRPIVPETERIKMLVHLRHVDIVTVREADHDIGDLIRLVRPDVLVTSSSTTDFDEKMKREYKDVCGKIITMPPQATTSTTARIRNLTIEGAEELANEVVKLTQDFLDKIKKGK